MPLKKPVNILLVDDEPANLQGLDAVLGELNENLVHAASGQEALKHVLNMDFAAILLDLNMPGMSGFEVAQMIRTRPQSKTIPIIFITASGAGEFPIDTAYELGAVDYLVKPVNAKVVRAKISFFVDLYRKNAEIARLEKERFSAELDEKEERYRTLIESMDQGFCVIEMLFGAEGDPTDYRFLELNPMVEKHIGLPAAPGKTIKELVPEIDAFWLETYARVATTGEPIRLENWSQAMGRWFDVYASRVGNANSNKVALLFSDITARKHAEENLRDLASSLAESDRRKTEFLATLAHELRNPLAPIRSGLGVMRLAGNNPETANKIQEMMERQVTHMVRLIDDLLDVARISGGKLDLKKDRHELKTILASAVETSRPLIDAAQHELIVTVPDDSLFINADSIRISQVVANLLNNSAKYTPPGGRIELTAQRDIRGLVIIVKDNGLGIPPDALATIFEMFNQVGKNLKMSQGGLGIGLALVRRIVELHGGSVEVASDGPRSGSTFTVTLPLALINEASDMNTPGEFPDLTINAEGKLKVLVVDDNIDAAEILSTMLTLSGHTTRVAHNGVSGLAMAKQFKPDVAFLDIGMPGMNGYETAYAVRKTAELDGIVLVALTGWGSESDREKSKEAGFDQHLTKPADFVAIHNLLSDVIKSRTFS